MKFFTYEWWMDCQGPGITTDPQKEYRRHLDAIRNKLTPEILSLEDDVSLHDGELSELFVDLPKQAVTMRLNGDDGRGGLHRLTLEYAGVTVFRSRTSGRSGLSGPAGYGDLGYQEVDLVDGRFVHRFLFSTGIELEIVFVSLELQIVDGVPPS